MQKQQPLKVNSYLDGKEIEAHMSGVEYIILAAPSVREDAKFPIHFTIFLNTQDILPQEIREAILEKFCFQLNIIKKSDILSEVGAVAFALTSQDTPMPLHLFKDADRKALPHIFMHIIDFEGDSSDFTEPKNGLTGWSYSYV